MIHEMLIIVSQGDLSGTKIDQRFETEKTLLENRGNANQESRWKPGNADGI